jgi:ABC-type dipeptide/oligopeptide/nickel transport system permease component
MFGYIVRRLAFGVFTIVGVSIVVFVVMRVLPGDPLVAIFGTEGFTKLTPAQRDNYMAALGLNDPLPLQYWHWVLDIARGEFGHSFFRSESVADTIARRGPLTAEIALLSVVLSWVVGIPVAILGALRPDSVVDNIARFFSICTMPEYICRLQAVRMIPVRSESVSRAQVRRSACRLGVACARPNSRRRLDCCRPPRRLWRRPSFRDDAPPAPG